MHVQRGVWRHGASLKNLILRNFVIAINVDFYAPPPKKKFGIIPSPKVAPIHIYDDHV
jgi:hypothetical protein